MGPLVAVLADYWRPGWRAGGPIVSLSRLVDRTDCKTVVFTRNHDLGDPTPYPSITPNTWVASSSSRSMIAYLTRWSGVRWAARQLREQDPVMIHINSLHSPTFGILPLIAAKFRLLRTRVLLITPHGELAASAQQHKRMKKSLARPLLRLLVPARAIWHASSPQEARDVAHWLKREPALVIAPDPAPDPAPRASSGPDQPTVLFASRIHPIKGLDEAIRIMGSLHVQCRFVIAGEPENLEYWAKCQALLTGLPRHIEVVIRGSYSPDESQYLMDEASVLLLPTKGENFGQVIAEALSRGCAVAIPPTTPWMDYVGPDLGCVDASPDALARFLTDVLTEPPEQRHKRRAAVLHAYTQWFTATATQDLYADAIELAGVGQ